MKKKCLMLLAVCCSALLLGTTTAILPHLPADAAGGENGVFSVYDDEGNRSLMLTHRAPHGAEGVTIEFDMLTAPHSDGNNENYDSENHRLRFFAGMPEDTISQNVKLVSQGVIGAPIAFDTDGGVRSYTLGLSFGAAEQISGTENNVLTATNTWNFQFDRNPFTDNTSYRVEFGFSSNTLIFYSKPIGSGDWTVFLTVENYTDPYRGTGDPRAAAINDSESGYAGIFFEDVNAVIDNFKVTDASGAVLADQSFGGEFIADETAGKKIYGGDLVLSAYTRNNSWGMFGTEQDDGAAALVVADSMLSAGIAGVDSVGGEIVLKEEVSAGVFYDAGLGIFDPWEYLVSVSDATDDVSVTEGFDSLENLEVNYYVNGEIAEDPAQLAEDTVFTVNYRYTDLAGNSTFASFPVTVVSSVSSLSGTITAGNSAVQGATIAYSYGETSGSVTTDETGNYSISEIPNSTEVSLTVTKEGYHKTEGTVTVIGNTDYDITLRSTDVLYITGDDTEVTVLSHGKRHGENGVVFSFDVIEGPNYTGNVYGEFYLFAGAEDDTMSEGQYTPMLSTLCFRENNDTVRYDGNKTAVVTASAGKKFVAGNTYRVTVDNVAGTMKVEVKATASSDAFQELVSVTGIENTGSGHSGIVMFYVGLAIDNYNVYDINGGQIGGTGFETDLSSESEPCDYGGNITISRLRQPTDSKIDYVNMTAKMLAGNNMESRLNIPMEIRLKQDNDTAIEISQPFEVYGRIETITGVSSVDENTEGLTVAFYKDGAAAELKEGLFPGEGEYLIQYTYESEHNRCYAYEIITVTEKKVTTISVEGNYAKIYEVGESFDVTGLMLVVNYTIGESEKIPLTQEMVTLDTSVPGEDILLTFRYEGAELVDLVTVTEKTYTISGKVTLGGTALSGITVGYGENAECTTDAEGNFSFRVEAGANIILTVEESDTYKAFSLEIGAISEDTVRNIELKEKSGQTQPPQEPAGTEGGCQGCGGILKAETGIVFALAVIAAGICLFVKKKRS